ncbi:ATP-binding protein [Scytonema sp. PRP1]
MQDTGIGIPLADQLKLFEPFYRATNVERIGGTGLGLSIVKQCVDLHGGQVTVQSEIGVGTTFTVRLPLGQSVGR